MTGNPGFRAWTAKAVEHRVLEAAETLMLCPRANGPRQFGSSMPEPLRDQRDAYAMQTVRYRRRPDAAAIDRMEECWDWINAMADEQDRQLLYDWAKTKCARGRSLKGLAKRRQCNGRTLRRAITRICLAVANDLNRAHKPNLGAEAVAENVGGTEPKSVEHCAPYWRAPDAKAGIDPSLSKTRLL